MEQRVRRLLAFADATSLPVPALGPPRAAPALALAALFFLSLVALGTSAPLAIHAATESVLQALK